jgi:hypothetical protein
MYEQRTRRRARVASGLVASLLALILVIPSSALDAGSSPESHADWWSDACDHIEREEYRATPDGDAGLQASNRAQGFRAHYRPVDVEIVPRDLADDWRFSWRTARIGRPGRMVNVGEVTPRANGSEVTYVRPGLLEWYDNGKAGLEQWFRIEGRPDGDGALTIEGHVGGGLHPRQRADGEVDLVDARGNRVLHYGKLAVWDAGGQPIDSHLAVASDGLSIVIDDSGARYPLTVDPLLTSAWTFESNQVNATLGGSVCTAGDVNGDGFSDVIVGARLFDGGQVDEGRVFVFHGSADGLSITPDWTAESNQAAAWFGFSVACAGDVNDDGYDDVVIGANAYDNGQSDEGRAYVYHGSAAGLAATPAWTVESNQAWAYLGHAVASAGDVNNDGYSDVIVGVIYFDNGQTDEGRAYVYHGSVSGLTTTPSWTAEADRVNTAYGSAVATAGDVNADGYDDVIVGAHLWDNGQTDEGRVYVYHGSASGIAASSAWTYESNHVQGWFGFSVSTAGDANGDGYADIIVGGPRLDSLEPDDGIAYLYRGSAAGVQGAAPIELVGLEEASAEFGSSVATAGDVNGDGYADVVVGEPLSGSGGPALDRGTAYLFLGSANLPALRWTGTGSRPRANFGSAVGTAGDVNGDGYSDVIVGSPLYENGQTDEGQVHVFHGGAEAPASVAAWSSQAPRQDDARFGMVASAGDVNGDGYSDMIIGASFYDDPEADEGAAFAYAGSASGPVGPIWTGESGQAGALFGFSVSSAGDVDGDGYGDVIVGAPDYTNGETNEGRAYVYSGSDAGLSDFPSWVAESSHAYAYFGCWVSSAGDVNGDGFSDVIVGAFGYDGGEADEGRAYVYHGSPEGLGATPAWTAESGQVGAYFGRRVATAGDVNGDGFSDVIVAAELYDAPTFGEGRAFVYYGSSDGLSLTPAWTAESDESVALFGSSVASAGDVNGDMYSDVIIGARQAGDADEGRVFVYHGSATGLSLAPDFIFEGNQGNAFLSESATAGDVNGDGFSDVIIGARDFVSPPSYGRVWVLAGSPAGLSSTPLWIGQSGQDDGFGWRVSMAGDVNGDGFGDLLVGAQGIAFDGRADLFYGNKGDGLDRIARQARVGNEAPIAILGVSDSPSAFRLKAIGRTPAGRGRVRLQTEVRPHGSAFDGDGLIDGPWLDTGAPGAGGSTVPIGDVVHDREEGTLYRWRVRIVSDSPYFPRTPWLSLPDNAATEADVRTSQPLLAIGEGAGSPASIVLEGAPNPFVFETQVAYTLSQGGRHRVVVYDTRGRTVVVLTDEILPPGQHVARWDGRNAAGRRVAAGTYFVRLESQKTSVSSKVALTR